VSRVLLITPARDEAAYLEQTIRAVIAQTRAPDLWLIVDDGSTDATPRILERFAAEAPFLRILQAPIQAGRPGEDRLTIAAEARAFNAALATVDLTEFTHVGKLDADVELPSDYMERLLEHFAAEPQLGVAGGTLLERGGGSWRPTKVPAYHVRGALKLYSRECFEAIGGIEERLGWDTIDETYARMHGYATRSLPDLAARHHRPVATRGGTLRGRARHGHCAYILRYSPWWVALRSFKVACSRPLGLSGIAFIYGYARSAVRREDRVEDERFRRFVAAELRARARPTRIVKAQISDRAKAVEVPTFSPRS
jgi:glycosyltransferase involved in cell wall biosynthesis